MLIFRYSSDLWLFLVLVGFAPNRRQDPIYEQDLWNGAWSILKLTFPLFINVCVRCANLSTGRPFYEYQYHHNNLTTKWQRLRDGKREREKQTYTLQTCHKPYFIDLWYFFSRINTINWIILVEIINYCVRFFYILFLLERVILSDL